MSNPLSDFYNAPAPDPNGRDLLQPTPPAMPEIPLVRPRTKPPVRPPAPDPELSITQFLSSPPAVWRDYFEALPIDRAIDSLGSLRRIAEMAAEVINRRNAPVEDTCYVCGEKIPLNKAPVQRIAWRDHATGLDMGGSICSVYCVREFNRKKMGMAELVK